MSLDVYLTRPLPPKDKTGIVVRQGGIEREVTMAEWNERFPGCQIVSDEPTREEVYWRNITHNLSKMADAAGIYDHLWRPDEIGATKAAQLISPLEDGLRRLQANPATFKVHNPSNGWGDYDGLISFVSEYLAACRDYPDADVHASR